MRIQHNILAMNAYRNYNTNTSALSKNLEKLSSGYKINRAGDDAAGLAISEKMRAQITGLSAAQKNVKDGISLVKTAEGAMQEIQDMLNRMEYLATQSANGTYDDDVDRLNLQKEVDQLKEEINRIADSANFNGIKLLNGDLDKNGGLGTASTAGEMQDVVVTAEIDGVKAPEDPQKGEYTIDLSGLNLKTGSAAATGTVKVTVAGKTIATITCAGGSNSTFGATAVGSTVKAYTVTAAAASMTIGGVKFSVTASTGKIELKMKEDLKAEFTTDMTVTYTGSKVSNYGVGTDKSTASNNAWTDSVRIDKAAIYAPDRRLASGYFEIGANDIKDGYQLKIGNETYTFAVGKDSKYKGASNVVNLVNVNKSGAELAKEAARRLTQVASNNTMFKVTSDNTSNKVHLTEIEGKVDYDVNDLQGTTAQRDGDWTGLVKSGTANPPKTTTSGNDKGLTLQIGDTSDTFNQLKISIGDMHTKGVMGIDGVSVAKQKPAQDAIQTIKDAINYVSGIRGDLGAAQNRLEHTANNLSVMAENIQDAESTIRDTDIAEEMMSYTKNNILVQSAQAMLAQANAVPQGVLQLLG